MLFIIVVQFDGGVTGDVEKHFSFGIGITLEFGSYIFVGR